MSLRNFFDCFFVAIKYIIIIIIYPDDAFVEVAGRCRPAVGDVFDHVLRVLRLAGPRLAADDDHLRIAAGSHAAVGVVGDIVDVRIVVDALRYVHVLGVFLHSRGTVRNDKQKCFLELIHRPYN